MTLTPIHFTPSSSTFAGEGCGGVRFTVTGRDSLRPVALGIEIAVALRDLYPVDWQREKLISLLANRDTFERLERSDTADSTARSWEKGLDGFRERRAKYLLY